MPPPTPCWPAFFEGSWSGGGRAVAGGRACSAGCACCCACLHRGGPQRQALPRVSSSADDVSIWGLSSPCGSCLLDLLQPQILTPTVGLADCVLPTPHRARASECGRRGMGVGGWRQALLRLGGWPTGALLSTPGALALLSFPPSLLPSFPAHSFIRPSVRPFAREMGVACGLWGQARCRALGGKGETKQPYVLPSGSVQLGMGGVRQQSDTPSHDGALGPEGGKAACEVGRRGSLLGAGVREGGA